MLPNFIGIGAPKAGTTWLYRCLAEHPEIFVAAVKETNFFDYESDDLTSRLSEYEAHFTGATGARAVGEISTRYLDSPWGAPERIRHLLPDARLFVSLRNPIDQVYSHYWHLRRQAFHQGDPKLVPSSFEAALDRYPDKLLKPASYRTHLLRWLQCFDASQLHVLLYDEIAAEPEGALRRLYGFLRVDQGFRPRAAGERGSSVRRGTSPRSAPMEWIRQRVYRGINDAIYHPIKRIVGSQSAVRMKDALRAREILERIFMRQGYPKMRQATRSSLRRHFADEVWELGELIGRDLSHWR